MKLSRKQIEQLQRSAQNPGRPPTHAGPADAPPPDRDSEESGQFRRILDDAMWAVERIWSGPPAHTHAPAEKPLVTVEAPSPPEEMANPASAGTNPVAEWQPVSTAPFDRALEVRLGDGLGPYPLLYPCRLVANKGWVNALSGAALTVEPVEWRDWQEKTTDFR